MKKITKLALAAMCVALGAGAFVACGEKGGETPGGSVDDGKITVTFYDGQTVLDTVELDKGSKVTRPATDPTKDGYDFVRWCGTPSYSVPFNFDNELEEDTSVFAGFRSQEAVEATYFILGESASSDLFKEVGWKDVSQGTDPEKIPAKNLFTKSETQGNLFTLTADLYVGDKFQIVNTETGWANQIGYGYLTPSQQSTAEDAMMKSGGGLGEGAKKANIQVGVAGNYTISLYVDKDGKLTEFEYVRNGDAAELAVEYEYYIKGNHITAWQDMIVPYTKFTTEDNEVYTLTIGMKADDDFMFLTTKRGDLEGKPSSLNATSMTLDTDADTAAAVEAGKSNFKIKGGEGTYTFTITEDGESRKLSAEKTADTLPQYDYYVKGSMGGDTNWEERHAMTLDKGMYKVELEMAKDDEFTVTVANKGDEEKTEVIAVNGKYANMKFMSNQIEITDKFNFKAKAADTYTISIDPVTMLVTVEGVHDTVTYTVGLWGSYNGSGTWAYSEQTCKITTDAQALTGSITVTLAKGDVFGFKTDRNGAQTGWANAAAAEGYTFTVCDGFSGDGNLTCETAGTYKFDFVINADGTFKSVTVTKAEA